MFETNPDFVFTVTRDFVRSCQNPILVLPDEVPAHPYAVAMECAMLAPKAEVSLFPWKEPKERIPAGGAPDSFVSQGASARLAGRRLAILNRARKQSASRSFSEPLWRSCPTGRTPIFTSAQRPLYDQVESTLPPPFPDNLGCLLRVWCFCPARLTLVLGFDARTIHFDPVHLHYHIGEGGRESLRGRSDCGAAMAGSPPLMVRLHVRRNVRQHSLRFYCTMRWCTELRSRST
jgi:hypothetical protein